LRPSFAGNRTKREGRGESLAVIKEGKARNGKKGEEYGKKKEKSWRKAL